MKKQTWMTVAFLASLMVGASAQANDAKAAPSKVQKVKKETAEAVDAAQDYATEQRDEFQARMKRNINEIDAEIATLKEDAHQKSGEVRETTKKKIAQLQKKRDELNKKYAAFEKSSGAAWTRMKSGLEKAWGEVRSAYTDAKTELSSDTSKGTGTSTK